MLRRSSLGLALAFVAAAALPGCLSPKHTLTPHELARLARLPAEARGERVRVVQQISDSDETPPQQPLVQERPVSTADTFLYLDLSSNGGSAPARTASSSGQWRPPAPSGSAPPAASGSWRPTPSSAGWTRVDDDGAAARAIRSAPPVGVGGASASPTTTASTSAPASGGGGSASGGGSSTRFPSGGGWSRSGTSGKSGKSSSGDGADAAAAAALALVVVAFVAATFAGVALAATEGARFEGDVRLHPQQPVHLVSRNGTERIVPLHELHLAGLEGVREGYVREDAGFGMSRLARAPLDRRGLALRLGAGATSVIGDPAAFDAMALDLQIGVFPFRRFGLLGTLGAAFTDSTYAESAQVLTLGLELQGYPVALGPLHLGVYGRAGTTLPGSGVTSDSSDHYGFAGSAGGLVELELTTTFALTGRLGWQTAFVPGDARRDGLLATVGIAIY